ncbi:tyrosine-protein phosphatase [Sphingomonas sp. CL5.1]|nr:tyrosine-protein phosphatase [Sphingomonas sp. CL5.1]
MATLALTALVVTAPLGQPLAAKEAPERVATQAHVIPFRATTVTQTGDAAEIRWSAPGAGAVKVYAGDTPDTISYARIVARGGETGSARVTGLTPGKRRFFALVPARGERLVVADRLFHLATVPNLRDIGGYRTADGRWVRMGMIYRSDQLDQLSDVDLATLSTLDIGVVGDLRTAGERQHGPDRLPAGAQPLVLDVIADSKDGVAGDMHRVMDLVAKGDAAKMLTDANREMVTLKSARDAYSTMLARLELPETGAMLYHCTAGKDRTGWATAVILTILGVPRETVMADYLESNVTLKAKNEKTLAMLARPDSKVTPTMLEPLLTVRPAYINAAFAEVDRRYGSFDNYVHQAFGLNDAGIKRLRVRFLTGAPVRR